MINQFFDELIWTYAVQRKKVRIDPVDKEIFFFTAFFHIFMEQFADDKAKYSHMKTLGLALIRQNKLIYYKKIREAVRSVHLRSKNHPSVRRSKTLRTGRKRAW